jgi:integrase/recombinase XerD
MVARKDKVKEYLSGGQHSYPTNPNAPLISGVSRSMGRSLSSESLNHIYARYKNKIYPQLLDSPSVTPEDKPKLKELLRKPRNPYLAGRHTSLTAKSKILKETTLRVFSGWTPGSDMRRRYVHLFGNAKGGFYPTCKERDYSFYFIRYYGERIMI